MTKVIASQESLKTSAGSWRTALLADDDEVSVNVACAPIIFDIGLYNVTLGTDFRSFLLALRWHFAPYLKALCP